MPKPPKYSSLVLNKIDLGLHGKNTWLPIPFPRTARHIGAGRQMYVLIGGDPGSGKTAFTHLAYVLGPYAYWKMLKDRDEHSYEARFYIRHMERSVPDLLGKWVCLRLFTQYGILMDIKTLYSYGSKKSYITEEVYQKVKEMRDYIDEMQDYVKILPGSINPTGIWSDFKNICEAGGKLLKAKTGKLTYVPNDPNELVIYVLDHIGNLRGESGLGERAVLDKAGEYLKIGRDRFGFSPVVVNQFNRGLSSPYRQRGDFSPDKSDFKGSGSMYEDADVAIAIFNPNYYGVSEYLGYTTQHMISKGKVNRFRSANIIKNSFGVDNVKIGLRFIGECGLFDEMPKVVTSLEQYEQLSNLIGETKQVILSSRLEDI